MVYADSERNADLYYLTNFLAGDPFLFVEQGGKRELFLSDLEVDRGKNQSAVDAVVRVADIVEAAKKQPGGLPSARWQRLAHLIRQIASERGLTGFDVPDVFPAALADSLRGLGIGVSWAHPPFVPARAIKTAAEVENIRGAVRHTEAAMQHAIDRIASAAIGDDGLLYEGDEKLTSEMVRFGIDALLLERHCYAYEAIVAGGEQGCDPHERGHGPLPAHRPIILDIFPRDLKTRYHGDMTRTVVRGKASDDAKKLYRAVADAKARAEELLRNGVDGHDVHAAVEKTFEDQGFTTGQKDGRMVGFFHGTGHGLGLDVHEAPRLGKAHDIMRTGHVVTVEPGLYYPGIGGVRIEDDVLITADGCENLCTMPSMFELG